MQNLHVLLKYQQKSQGLLFMITPYTVCENWASINILLQNNTHWTCILQYT